MEFSPLLDFIFLQQAERHCATWESGDASIAATNIATVLYFRARRGEAGAISGLISAASYFASAIQELSLEKPVIFQQTAKSLDEWPSMISFHPDWKKDNDRIISTVHLGKTSPLRKQVRLTRFKGAHQTSRLPVHVYCQRMVELVNGARAWSQHKRSQRKKGRRERKSDLHVKPTDKEALLWCEWLKACSELPLLSARSAYKWFSAGWQGMRLLTERRPEELPDLREVGAFREFYRDAATNYSLGARRSSVREGIKMRLKDAFMKRFGR